MIAGLLRLFGTVKITVVLLFIFPLSLSAEETNVWGSDNLSLPRFWQAVENRSGPISVMAFGDSLQVPHQSLCTFLFETLASRLGKAGNSFSWPLNFELAGGAAWTPSGAVNNYWWMQHLVMPPGATATWRSSQSGGGTLCDAIGLYYSVGPEGGQIQIDIATNGGSWSSVQLLDTFNPTIESRYAKWQLPLGYYQMRVASMTGVTNRILGPEMLNSQSNGISVSFLSNGGANLKSILSFSPQILNPVFSNIHPDLIVWHMKELGDLGETSLNNELERLEVFWQTVVPQAEVIYIGTPYLINDATNAYTEIQNRLVRNLALRNGRCYLDCMTPFVSYSAMVTNGYLADPVHISNLGYAFMNSLVWDELCFEALRQDRRLVAQGTLQEPIISFQSFTNIEHVLEVSTNLLDWNTTISVLGDGTGKYVTNTAVTSPVFYRMYLR